MSRDTSSEVATHHDPEDKLAIGEAARLLGVSVGTVRRWEEEGKLTATRTLGGQRRFRRGDLSDALAEAQESA